MKARYQYRFYPTDQQRQSLAQLFGCVRVVWNDALAICKQSARFRIGGFSIKGNSVYLAKIGDVSPIWSRELPSSPSSVTVIKDAANRYFLSFVVETPPVQVEAKNHSIGIDLGIKTFAAMSNGEMVKSPDYSKLDKRLRRKQKQLACHDSKRTRIDRKTTSVAR
jgi:putative transposase